MTLDDAALRARRIPVLAQVWAAYEEFTAKVTDHTFHPFIAADHEQVVESPWPHCRCARPRGVRHRTRGVRGEG